MVSFPNRNQGIILPALDEVPVKDYMLTVGSCIKPKKFDSHLKCQNGRIGLLLDSFQSVDEIVRDHPQTKVNEQILTPTRLINPTKRIIISNAYRRIELTTSSISFMKMGTSKAGYEHLFS